MLTQKDKKFLLYISVLVGLYILPIMLVDFYYADDLYRSLNGVSVFDKDGRILSYIYFLVFSFGKCILDFSPLNLIFSGVALILSSFLVYKRFFENISSPIIASFLGFLFIASPFFLTNLSYKYDCITMSLSVFFSIYSLFILTKNTQINIKKVSLSVLFLTASLLFYQPACTNFISLTALWLVVHGRADKRNIFISSICVFIISYFIYFGISKPFIRYWIAEQTHLISLNVEGFHMLMHNLYMSFNTVKAFFEDSICYVLFAFPCFISWIYLIYKNRNQFLNCIVSIFLPILLFFSMILPMLPFTTSTFAPRILIGFMSFLLFSWIGSISLLDKTRYNRFQYFIIFPLLYCLSFSYLFSNDSKAQKIFDTQLVGYIADDLKSTNHIQQIGTLVILGNKPLPPERRLLEQKRPLLRFLIQSILDKNTWTSQAFLQHFPVFKIKEVFFTGLNKEADLLAQESHSFPVIKENNLYTLKVMHNIAVIEYKDSKPPVL